LCFASQNFYGQINQKSKIKNRKMDRLEQLKNLLAGAPDDSFITFAIAKEYEKTGNADEALNHYLMIAEHDPNYVGLYYHLGKLYEERGDMATAISTYENGMKIAKTAGDDHAFSELAGAKMAVDG